MSPKQVLMHCLTLLFREHQREDNLTHSGELVNEVLDTIRTPSIVLDSDRSFHIMSELKALIYDLVKTPVEQEIDRSSLLQRIRIICEDDENLYLAFQSVAELELDEESLTRACSNYRNKLTDYIKQHKIRDIFINQSKIAYKNDPRTNWRDIALETMQKLEPFTTSNDGEKDPGVVSEVTLDDENGLLDFLDSAIQADSPDGVLRTGLQGVNLLCGKRGGFREGEFILTSAKEFGNKSGFALEIFTHIPLFNVPKLRDPKRKPLLQFISAENEMDQNLMWIYEYLKANIEGIKVDKNKTDKTEAAHYIKDHLTKNGWHFDFARVLGDEFTYQEYFNRILKLEAKGYEVKFSLVDYLNMFSKKGCIQGTHGDDTRDLFRRVRNFTSSKKITFMTPHQAGTDATALLREDTDNLAKKMAGKNYYDSCKRLGQEPDLEIVGHVVKKGDKSYYTLARGKHRYTHDTPESHQFVVYPFSEVGSGIGWDVDKEPKYLRKVPSESSMDMDDFNF